jgi:hypothetical protein
MKFFYPYTSMIEASIINAYASDPLSTAEHA